MLFDGHPKASQQIASWSCSSSFLVNTTFFTSLLSTQSTTTTTRRPVDTLLPIHLTLILSQSEKMSVLPTSGRGTLLFAAGMTSVALAALYVFRRTTTATITNPPNNTKKTISCHQLNRIVAKMEALIQQDEGHRGIKQIVLPPGELLSCAKFISHATHVVIITGFPCMIDFSPPTETDGPLGAIALAKTLLHLGKEVTVLTDECNEEVLLACAAGANIQHFGGRLSLQSFPAKEDMDDMDWGFLEQVSEKADLLIAIERAGPNKNGR